MILQRNVIILFLLVFSSATFSGEFSWRPEVGLGYDSNIYRAPDSDYIDYAKICIPNVPPGSNDVCQIRDDGRPRPSIQPKVQSGAFADVNFEGVYRNSIGKNSDSILEYDFQGRFYLESKYSNADQYSHNLKLGVDRIINKEKKRKDSIYGGLVYGYKKKLYLDRDSGDEQEFDNRDVSGRYTYDMLGVEARFKKRTGSIQYKIDADYQQKVYVDEIVVSKYDHDYYRLGGDVSFPYSKATKLTAGYDYSFYDYKYRPSRNQLGKLFRANPTREYEYNRIKTTLRHRFDKSWVTYLDYEWKNRVDRYQGYDNYTKNLVKTRIHYSVSRDTKVKFSLGYWERDYPNAFAFNNAVKNIKKEYDGVISRLGFETRQDKHTSYLADLRYNEENSSDLRYSYDRFRLSFAIAWEY